MRGRKIGEIGSSSIGMYIRNIADITPDWSDISSTADIPEIGKIRTDSGGRFAHLFCLSYGGATPLDRLVSQPLRIPRRILGEIVVLQYQICLEGRNRRVVR